MDYSPADPSLSMGFSKQEYWSGLPLPSPGHLSDPRIEPGLLHCRQILYHLSYRNANQKRNAVSSHSSQNGHNQKVYKQLVLGKVWRKAKRLTLSVGMQTVQPLWRTVWRLLKKLEIELPYDPAIPLLGIHTEETRIERDTYPNVHRSTVYNS